MTMNPRSRITDQCIVLFLGGGGGGGAKRISDPLDEIALQHDKAMVALRLTLQAVQQYSTQVVRHQLLGRDVRKWVFGNVVERQPFAANFERLENDSCGGHCFREVVQVAFEAFRNVGDRSFDDLPSGKNLRRRRPPARLGRFLPGGSCGGAKGGQCPGEPIEIGLNKIPRAITPPNQVFQHLKRDRRFLNRWRKGNGVRGCIRYAGLVSTGRVRTGLPLVVFTNDLSVEVSSRWYF